jgi:hypothetical protein
MASDPTATLTWVFLVVLFAIYLGSDTTFSLPVENSLCQLLLKMKDMLFAATPPLTLQTGIAGVGYFWLHSS